MKRNKNIFLILSFILLPMLVLFAGCGNTHNILKLYDTNETYHWNSCLVENCEDHIKNKEEHDFELVFEKEPTCEVVGQKVYKCKICNYIKNKEVPTVPHAAWGNYWEWTWGETKGDEFDAHYQECYMCGEEMNKGPHVIKHISNTEHICEICEADFGKADFGDINCKECAIDMQFATINITGASLTSSQVLSGSKVLEEVVPGDCFDLVGAVSTADTTVDIYLAIYVDSITILGTDEEIGEKTYDIDLTEVLGNAVTTSNAAISNNLSGNNNVVAISHPKLAIYKISALNNSILNYSGTITFATTLANSYTHPNGKTYVLNNSGSGMSNADFVCITGLQIDADIKIAAIQADNIEETAVVSVLEQLVGFTQN